MKIISLISFALLAYYLIVIDNNIISVLLTIIGYNSYIISLLNERRTNHDNQ